MRIDEMMPGFQQELEDRLSENEAIDVYFRVGRKLDDAYYEGRRRARKEMAMFFAPFWVFLIASLFILSWRFNTEVATLKESKAAAIEAVVGTANSLEGVTGVANDYAYTTAQAQDQVSEALQLLDQALTLCPEHDKVHDGEPPDL
jgi:hypothetical protein